MVPGVWGQPEARSLVFGVSPKPKPEAGQLAPASCSWGKGVPERKASWDRLSGFGSHRQPQSVPVLRFLKSPFFLPPLSTQEGEKVGV